MPESETWDENNLTSRERNDLILSRIANTSSGPVQVHKMLLTSMVSCEFLITCFSSITGLESSYGCSLAFTLQVPLFLVSKSHDLNVNGPVWELV